MTDLLDGPAVRRALRELAVELGPGRAQHVLVMAGGAVLALHGLREATHDIDALTALDDELRAAADRVAVRLGLVPGRWLNSSATPWRPQTLHEQDCEVVLQHPRLLVLGAPLREVFLMKLVSMRTRDAGDLPALWPRAGFSSPEEAVSVLYEQAYPGEEPDEHLIGFLRTTLGLPD